MRPHAPPRLLPLHGPSRNIAVPGEGSSRGLLRQDETSQRFVDSSTGFWLLYPGDGAAVVAMVGLLLLPLLGHHAALSSMLQFTETGKSIRLMFGMATL